MSSNITSGPTGMGESESSAKDIVILSAPQDGLCPMSGQEAANPGFTEVYTTLSTSNQFYYAEADKLTYVSSSQGELRQALDAKLDPSRLALALCSNLPSIFRSAPFWKGVRTVAPGHTLNWETGAATVVRSWKVALGGECTAGEAQELLRRALTAAVIDRVNYYRTISADLSGGMDSTSLSYLVSTMAEKPYFYHARTTDAQNRDTDFARRAANDMRGTYVELEPFPSTISAFSTTDDADIRDSHDGPWSWGSNALHLKKLLTDAASRGVRAHLTGLGGDELFSTLPSLALALYRRGQRRRAARSVVNMAKKQRWGIAATLSAAASRRSLGAELLQRVRTQAPPSDGPRESLSWAPGFALSPFASARTRELVEERVSRRSIPGCLHGSGTSTATRSLRQ